MSKQRTLSGLIVGDFDELTVESIEDDFSLLGALEEGDGEGGAGRKGRGFTTSDQDVIVGHEV